MKNKSKRKPGFYRASLDDEIRVVFYNPQRGLAWLTGIEQPIKAMNFDWIDEFPLNLEEPNVQNPK